MKTTGSQWRDFRKEVDVVRRTMSMSSGITGAYGGASAKGHRKERYSQQMTGLRRNKEYGVVTGGGVMLPEQIY